MTAPIESIWRLPDAALATIESDSAAIEGATLEYQPAQSHGGTPVEPEQLFVALPLDLGAAGATTVYVPVPISILREAYCAAAWHTIEAGERMVWVPRQEHVTVVTAPGPDGLTEVRSAGGVHRVPAAHLHRLRTFGGGVS